MRHAKRHTKQGVVRASRTTRTARGEERKNGFHGEKVHHRDVLSPILRPGMQGQTENTSRVYHSLQNRQQGGSRVGGKTGTTDNGHKAYKSTGYGFILLPLVPLVLHCAVDSRRQRSRSRRVILCDPVDGCIGYYHSTRLFIDTSSTFIMNNKNRNTYYIPGSRKQAEGHQLYCSSALVSRREFTCLFFLGPQVQITWNYRVLYDTRYHTPSDFVQQQKRCSSKKTKLQLKLATRLHTSVHP